MVATISACVSESGGVTTSHSIQPDCVTRKDPWCTPIARLSQNFKDYASSATYGAAVQVTIVSFPDILEAAHQGVDQTMVISTLTAPVAFALLAAVLRNARLLLITLLNIIACVTSTVLVMTAVLASGYTVSSEAPALILATALAMSIDYSLFLLSRFDTELHAKGRTFDAAVLTMLETSGHTVLVSGLTLCLCFLGMLLIPVQTIASMGISAAVTVFFGVGLALVLTPTLLLAAPSFFRENRRYGLTCDMCCCVEPCRTAASSSRLNTAPRPARTAPTAPMAQALLQGRPSREAINGDANHVNGDTATMPSLQLPERPTTPPPVNPAALPAPPATGATGASLSASGGLPSMAYTPFSERPAGPPTGCWARVGAFVQKKWVAPLVVLVLAGLAVPFAMPLSHLTYIEGLRPLLPRADASTTAFLNLQNSFGVSQVFPNTVVIVPPTPQALTDPQWLQTTCEAMVALAENVTTTLQAMHPPVEYTMSARDLSGLMIFNGKCSSCLGNVSRFLPGGHLPPLPPALHNRSHHGLCLTNGEIADVIELLPYKEAEQIIELLLNLFGNPAHSATKVHASTSLDPFGTDGQKWIRAMRDGLALVDNAQVGEVYFTGMAQEQMDGAEDTFAALPRVVLVTLAIVCIVLFAAFRAVAVPLRATLCLAWMLVVTFGSATAVYQDGALSGAGLSFLQPSGHGVFWMSPCIAFSIVVGLGLDYDIFLMESVIEFYDRGASPREALARALEETGNIICIAGVIMTLAFSALLVGASAVLNQIGYLLIVGVLIDCFVTTKVIIPCAMALLPGNLNFWPRRQETATPALVAELPTPD